MKRIYRSCTRPPEKGLRILELGNNPFDLQLREKLRCEPSEDGRSYGIYVPGIVFETGLDEEILNGFKKKAES